jgi:hypothetical protein
MSALFTFVFGLLPIWVNLAVVGYAYATGNNELGFIAMWVFLLSIPACAITLAIARATVVVHRKVEGSVPKKLASSGAVILAALLLCAFVAIGLWGRNQDLENELRSEAAVVEAFVARDPSVIAVVGQPKRTSVVTSSFGGTGSRPSSYEIAAEGASTIYAIVAVTRTGSQRHLRLVCTTPTYFGHRAASTDPCAK